ncbi:MAG: Ig-like domain-containing protein [Phycisphaerae bacterium]|nr:Ig-like domain-containing protein [Gemmatimonadaceae bacterium]
MNSFVSMVYRSRFASRWLILSAAALTVACSESDPVVPPALKTVSVTVPNTTIQAGLTTTATAAGLDQNGAPISTGTVIWSTVAPTVATVSATGVITAVAPGSTQILATAGTVSGQVTITVTPAPLVLTTITVATPLTSFAIGQQTTATAAGLDQNGAAIATGAVTWSTGSAAIATVSAAGVVTGVAAGTTQVIATAGGKTGQKTITITAPINVKINEVESNGGTPGDWIEFYNAGTGTADLSGYIVKDNDDTHATILPAGTTLAPGAYLVVEEAQLGYGLGAAESARLFSPASFLIEEYTWTAHAAVTYARCPNGTGTFGSSTVSTKGAANNCAPVTPSVSPWPGADNVTTVDGNGVFGENMSGLTYEAASAGRPAVLWAVKNGPGTLYRLIFSGGIWTPDPANNWSAGKALRYTNDTGNPDSEGVTFAAGGSAAGIYVATERNNDASTISRSSILRFDPMQAGATLRATNDWNITADLPVVGANLGIEAVTWLPDSFLVAKQFYDERAGKTYVPADYPDHGSGLFLVGVEGNGIIYVYALNHVTNAAQRVATFTSGFPGVMGLEFDNESGYLWAMCDDTCSNRYSILEINTTVGSATRGRFMAPRQFDHPSTLPNINNEGFAFAPNSECVNNRKPVFWADDSGTAGHSIRQATMACGAIPLTALRFPQ